MSGEEWTFANYDSLPRLREVTDQKLGRADIAIFFGHRPEDAKIWGVAYLGTACWNSKKPYKMSLNMWLGTPSKTAETVAHEIGHNIGMQHDFYGPHKDAGCDGTGIMSYYDHPMQWSKCSRADFEAHYLKYEDQWCMPKDKKACNNADA